MQNHPVIKEVEREIAGLRPEVLADWRVVSGSAVDDFLGEVEENPSRFSTVELAAALLAWRSAISAARDPRRLLAKAKTSAGRILRLGIRFGGGSVRGIRGGEGVVEARAEEAATELVVLSRARSAAPSIVARLERSAAELDRIAREERVLDELAARARADRDRPAVDVPAAERSAPPPDTSRPPTVPPPSVPGIPAPPPPEQSPSPTPPAEPVRPSSPPSSIDLERLRRELEDQRQAEVDRLRERLGDRAGHLSDAITDAWAFRLFNIGVLLAAEAAGEVELVAVNPMDERTTPFCRWVHGRVIGIRAARDRVEAFSAAVRGGDRLAIISAWPFISQSRRGLDEIRRENGGSLVNGFRTFFASVGLPPYHWRCRTMAVPRRRSGF